jgi:hypothetical protein
MRPICSPGFVAGLCTLISLLLVFCEASTTDHVLFGHPYVEQFALNNTYFDESQLVYGSLDNRIVYIRTHKGDVYRSNDEGRSFAQITTVLLMDRINQTTNKVWRHAKGAAMYDGSNVMYFWSVTSDRIAGYQQLLWVTTDGGLSFRLRLNSPRNVDNIIPHPKFPGVALLLQNTQLPGRSQLFKTLDAGLNWTPIFKPLVATSRVQWACTRTSPHRILAAATLGLTGATGPYWNNKVLATDDYFQTWRLYLDHVHDWRVVLRTPSNPLPLLEPGSPALHPEFGWNASETQPPLASPDASNPPAPSASEYYRMVWPAHEPEQEVRVLTSRYSGPNDVPSVEISRNPSAKWERQDAEWLPVEFARAGYLDSRTNGWHVYSMQNTSMNVLAWRSDSHHELYRVEVDWKTPWPGRAKSHLLLSHHKTSTYVDFETLPGLIVADQYALSAKNALTGAWNTLLSTSGGAAWQNIIAPDSNATHTRHLVFTGIANASPLVYSMPRNLGVIFATAASISSEDHLPLNYSHGNRPKVDTYVTHDGGTRWKRLGPGYQVPEFAANGAMWVTSDRNGNLVRDVTVSADEGQTWLTVSFTDEFVRIYNIRVTQDYNSRKVLIHASKQWSDDHPPSSPAIVPNELERPTPGAEQQPETVLETQPLNLETDLPPAVPASASPFDPSGTHIIGEPIVSAPSSVTPPEVPVEPTTEPSPPYQFQSIIFSLDFTHSFPRCTSGDYEPWTPTDLEGNVRCLMGEKITYRRRKAGHHCFPQNPPETDPSPDPWPIVLTREPCVCTLENFECAPCFEFDQKHGRCRFICGLEDQTFILSRYPTVPFKPMAACADPNAVYDWPGSKQFAMQKVSESKCTWPGPSDTALEFLDAIVPCSLAPTVSVPTMPIAKPPTKLSTLAMRALSFVIFTFCVIGIFFFVLRNLYTIQYRVGQVIEYFFPGEPQLGGRFEDWEFEVEEDDGEGEDEHGSGSDGNEVEMDEIVVPETTTSSDEEENPLD